MIWSFITRKNLAIVGIIILIALIGLFYTKYAIAQSNIEEEKAKVESLNKVNQSLKDDIFKRDKVISDQNKEIEKLLKEQEILQENLKSLNERLDMVKLEHLSIKNSLNSSLDSILNNPDSYETSIFDFNGKRVEKKQLTKQAESDLSIKMTDTMWSTYCQYFKCQ